MFRFRVAKAFILATSLLCSSSLNAQMTVFEDSQLFSGVYARTANEYGDEVILAGTARILTKIKFEYAADLFFNGDEKVRLRIYPNSGPAWMGNSDYPLVSERPLWESPYFYIDRGFHTKEIVIPSIKVPDRFTWTVQFYGISMQTGIVTPDPGITNDVAGLLFYGLAHIGLTYDDFWERLFGVGWTPVRVGGVYKNNFGAQITAIPEPVLATPSLSVSLVTLSPGYTKVRVRWLKALTRYLLQSKTQDGQWTNVPNFVEINGEFSEVYFLNDASPSCFFRLVVPPPNLNITLEGTETKLQWQAVSADYVLQSRDGSNGLWQDLPTPVIPAGNFFSVSLPGSDPNRQFRLRETLYAARLEIVPEGGSVRVRWPAAAKGYTLQSKPPSESEDWTTLPTPAAPLGDRFEVIVPITGEGQIFRVVY
jgi:hypothetical protein